MYQYRAEILRVVDGDTCHADVDLGFDSHQLMTLRLAGIDAPELSTPEGQGAKRWLEEKLRTADNRVVIRTIKDKREKFGRYLAELFIEGVSLNEELIAAGHALRYTGGPRG